MHGECTAACPGWKVLLSLKGHNGLKWLCGACGIQSRRWESLVWGKAECTKNNSESRRVQICKREERMCAFREDYNSSYQRAGNGATRSAPHCCRLGTTPSCDAYLWASVWVSVSFSPALSDVEVVAELLWKCRGRAEIPMFALYAICLSSEASAGPELTGSTATYTEIRNVYWLATAYVTCSGAKTSFLQYRNSVYSHFQPWSCSCFASLIFLTTILYWACWWKYEHPFLG